MQDALFPDEILPAPAAIERTPKGAGSSIQPATVDADTVALAQRLPPQLHLGTSSWSYPGWAGLVWAGEHGESLLSRQGLQVYARHPLMRTVSIDRNFYRALTAAQYERYAAQVPDDFRFVVKAPSLVSDAQVRDEDGRGQQLNTAFLDPVLAVQEFVQPALEGLGAKIGALVFQLSPLAPQQLANMPEVLQKLDAMLAALPSLQPLAPDGVIAVEVRDPAFLSAAFADLLKRHGATYCLGVHPKLGDLELQLKVLRRLWPGPLVCRWNLNARFGPFGYEEAQKRYGLFDQILDPDPATHALLSRVVRATVEAGHKAYVCISNHAEGCAPRTVQALAQALAY
ncbi:DUF72 domain-containing protein [Roseateles toxinivorans]|uniref:Uncharacterized protein YecE (DUF72 family) n=1 Tax=Roseateles toxinivorans TaxID=270368 RepID=A0A4R6QT54_9BURK|nr:DUF72 domain-containing protein [Roseateles toxinivorans]TDP74396.1 uncharacterized protein YecE (DUF72 family) [Roseateles toxinivorans]